MRKVLNKSMEDILGMRKRFTNFQITLFYSSVVMVLVLAIVLPILAR